MEQEQILGGLTPAERSIIDEMQGLGWVAMTDCRVEDGRAIGGDGFRTFVNEGRHDLVLILPKVTGRALPGDHDQEPKRRGKR